MTYKRLPAGTDPITGLKILHENRKNFVRINVVLTKLFRTDMCNPRPATLFGAARVVLFMILQWYFK